MKDEGPKLSEEEQEQLLEFEDTLRASRVRTFVGVSARDLKWILYLSSALFLGSVCGLLILPHGEDRTVVMMIVIAGSVVSMWGAVRGVMQARAGGVHGIGGVYAALFLMLVAMFVLMGLGLMGFFKQMAGKA